MSDLSTVAAEVPAPEDPAAATFPPVDEAIAGRQCNYVNEDGTPCLLRLPPDASKQRRYCDGHQKGGYLLRKPRGSGDKGPTINIKVPGTPGVKSSGLSKDQERVLEAANAWLGLVAGVLAASGDTVCAEATQQCAPQIAMQLALLAKYHPIIVKVLAPVEASGEALVWVSLLVAASPLIITVLSHHKVISEETASRIGIVTALGAVIGSKPEAEAAAA